MNNAQMKIDELKNLIAAGDTPQALAVIESLVTKEDYRPDYNFSHDKDAVHQFAKSAVHAVLGGPNPINQLVDAALNRFVGTRENQGGGHGYWVHSLSHLTSKLWEMGLKDQIKQLNEIAFIGANEFSDNNCCNRLVGDFLRKAPWDANPAEYGLTEENLRWTLVPAEYSGDNTEPEEGRKMLDKVKQYPFASKEAWEVRNK